MKNKKIIKGNEIENLITKFYYKNRHLYFQIILNLGLSGRVPYSEYDDYSLYKEKFNELLDAKNENKNILLPNSGSMN